MDDDADPWDRPVVLHTLLRLAALVAAALAVPRVLDHFGVRDVSWAPPDCGIVAEEASPVAPRNDAMSTGAAGRSPEPVVVPAGAARASGQATRPRGTGP